MGSIVFKDSIELLGFKLDGSFFSLEALDLEGNLVKMSKFQDKKAIIVVNVASKWGVANKNYKDLVKLYDKYSSKGLEVLAFPCSQFLNQEFTDPKEIRQHLKLEYNISFPIFSLTTVNGSEPHPVFKYMRQHSKLRVSKPEELTLKAKQVPWNFTKFLLNGKGEVVDMAGPTTKASTLEKTIERLLSE